MEITTVNVQLKGAFLPSTLNVTKSICSDLLDSKFAIDMISNRRLNMALMMILDTLVYTLV